jgi:hypothetical protein
LQNSQNYQNFGIIKTIRI